MAIFNEKIGANNYVILNVLRRKEELRGTAITQEGSAATAADPSGVLNVPAAADREPEAELLPPQPALIQQVDGTVSSAPSRGSSSPQEYDEFEDDHYSEEQAATRRKATPDEKVVRRINHRHGRAAVSKGGKNSPSSFRHD